MSLYHDDGIGRFCGTKGDVVEWVRQSEGVDWSEAIRILDAGRPLTNAWAGKAMISGDRTRPAPTTVAL